ncbi:glycosyltransferase family 2 protein [Luminiphilus sp.]|nr:glycosyltransferase family 2 protein [Luminiphilus sp.]MDA9711262.1 glycosyltransferase family 2 protein [Luminiphilus sp.]
MAKLRLAVVILHYGEQDHTLQCLRSVADAVTAAQDACLTATYIVDNNAATEPLQWPEKEAAQPEVIRGNSNLGFALGMNLGIRAATQKPCDYLWLLNNDTVVDRTSIANLMNHAESHPEQKLVGCTILDGATGRLTTIGGYRYSALLSAAWPIKKRGKNPDYIDGAAMLLCAKTAQVLGGLPVNNFMYFEELHLARALQREGLCWGSCEAARVLHLGGVGTATLSLDNKTYYLTTAALRYTSQHASIFLFTVWFARLVKAVFDSAVAFNPGALTGFARASFKHFFNWGEKEAAD